MGVVENESSGPASERRSHAPYVERVRGDTRNVQPNSIQPRLHRQVQRLPVVVVPREVMRLIGGGDGAEVFPLGGEDLQPVGPDI